MQTDDGLIWHVREHTIPAALSLLPAGMNSLESRAQMIAIGLHESEFQARVQNRRGALKKITDMDPKAGPARGFWQFERMGGVVEILTSPGTKELALPICRMFLYEPTPAIIHAALAHHDVLAAVFARLLLWRDPRAMPMKHEAAKGYDVYLRNWRPNPAAAARHAKDWPGNFWHAWEVAEG